MSKKRNVLITGLIFFAILVSHVVAAPTPLPGEGNHTLILFGVHPNAKDNEHIISFLAEHPDIRWHESAYNKTHEYIYITPVNECSEQLTYINKIGVDERKEPSIASVMIIGCDQELPLDPTFQFADIFENYSSLTKDQDLLSYIEDNSPGRGMEIQKDDSETEVYFIDDKGTFTEYIVTIRKGMITDNVVYGTFVSEDYFTINKSEAQADAAYQKPGWNLTGDVLLKIDDKEYIWEVPVSNGSAEETIYVPAELREGYSIMKTEPKGMPGFVILTAVFSIGIVFVIISRRRD